MTKTSEAVGKLASLIANHPVKLGAMETGSLYYSLSSCLPTDSSAFKKSEYEASMKKMQKQLTNAFQHIGKLEQRLVDDARQHRSAMQQVCVYYA
jgi:hypothetical protein